MPYYISYTLPSGPGSGYASTAAEAILTYNVLKDAGMGGISIRDEKGTIYAIEQLALLTLPPKMKRNRKSGPSR